MNFKDKKPTYGEGLEALFIVLFIALMYYLIILC